jgi:seryl-tRNA synthetase
MLDIKFVRNNPQVVKDALVRRGSEVTLDEFLQLDEERREKLFIVEQMKNRRNTVSEEIGKLKIAGQDAPDLVLEMRQLSKEIKVKDEEVKALEERLSTILLDIPNIPHASVPTGASEADNTLIRTWGTPRDFDFQPKPHWELGEDLNIIDFERGGKVTGARFSFYKGLGARLERAVLSFMLDLHTTEHQYVEVFPPFIVNRDSMVGPVQVTEGNIIERVKGRCVHIVQTAHRQAFRLRALRLLRAADHKLMRQQDIAFLCIDCRRGNNCPQDIVIGP